MTMTVSELTGSVQQLLNDPSGFLYPDAQVENWLALGAADAAMKTLGVRDHTVIYVPANDCTADLNKLSDVTLSGAPRLVKSQDLYFKCYPAKDGAETPATDPAAWKTYDDAILTGLPQRLGFTCDGGCYWVKGYPVAVEAGATGDDVQDVCYPVPDDAVAGDPAVFRINSNGSYYYFKAYRLANYAVGDLCINLPLPDNTLKILSLHRRNEGEQAIGLWRIHPRYLGHLDNAATPPRYFCDFGGTLSLTPVVSQAFQLDLHLARHTPDPDELPDELQPLIIHFAYVMALYADGKFRQGGYLYQRYLQSLLAARQMYQDATATDSQDQYQMPDRHVSVKKG